MGLVSRLWISYLPPSFYARTLWYNLYMKKVKGARNTDRQNGKASKKRPKMFDPIKRRLVTL